MNMRNWLQEIIKSPYKRAMPVLYFPSIQIMGININELIRDSDRQARGMKLIAQRTNAAAAISMMDLSLEAECFGSQISFSDYEVPTVVSGIVSSHKDAEELKVPKIGAGRSGIYIEAVEKATKLIDDRPVIAGAIGPFSLAGRLLDVNEAMIYCYEEPEMVHMVLEKASSFITEYCRAYKEVGANGVLLAEPLAGLLSPTLAAEFSSHYVKKIVDALQDESFIVIYHNCGNSVIQSIDSILSTGCGAYHFGNAISMKEMMKHIPPTTVAMGNIDPVGLIYSGTPGSIRQAVLELLDECSIYPNYVISSGCDIPPMTKWENIDAFFAAVEEYYCCVSAY